MFTIAELLNRTTNLLKENNIINAKIEAEMILSHYLNYSCFELYLNKIKIVNPEIIKFIDQAISRRIKFEPLQYILEEAYFWGNKFYVGTNVLIPRYETEILVAKIIENEREITSILEMGTGCGVISIILATEFSEAEIDATDISSSALKIAKKNADFHKVRINFIHSDLFDNINKKYDIIVSNPPYISEEEYAKLHPEIVNYEPPKALIAKENGYYFYDRILAEAKKYLNENGKIYFEIGATQAEKIKELAIKYGLTQIDIFKDLNKYDRIMTIS